MKLFMALNWILNSTTVRFIVLLLLSATSDLLAANEWRRDTVRELQVAERIHQWQQRGHFGAQYCWQPLRIDDQQVQSRPGANLLAAHPSRSDEQLRADYVRQQLYCLLAQQPAIRQAAVEQLRRRTPNLHQANAVPHLSVTERYSEVLASRMAYQWLLQHGETLAAQRAQQDWQFWTGTGSEQRQLAWQGPTTIHQPDWYARLTPTATNWAKR